MLRFGVTPERVFSASYDSSTKVISVAVCLIVAAVAWVVHLIFLVPLFALAIGLAYAYSPRGFAVASGAIVIRRLIGNIEVPLADVRGIRAGTADDFGGLLRLWGNGGLFGYTGLFQTTRLGTCRWYVTNRNNTVIVTTPTKTLVLSPDDTAGFIAAAGVPSKEPPGGAPLVPPGRNVAGIIAGAGMAVLVLAFIAVVVSYSPGPPAYTLTADRLSIHDRFYPVTLRADAVDTEHARIVDLTRESEWRPAARTNGFANSHYQSGWFRVASGRTVRLYRAGGNRLVLIPPKGDSPPVLYQAKDAEGFIQGLQREWAGR